MSNHKNETNLQTPRFMLTIISTPAKTEAMARYALDRGATCAYASYASGTVPNAILSFLGLADVRREIAMLPVTESLGRTLMDELATEFDIEKRMSGVVYLQSIDAGDAPVEAAPYTLIAAIVNEGDGERVVESARECHPVGATILRATGSADHSAKTFAFEIVPLKEIAIIVTRTVWADELVDHIYQSMRSDEPGRGVLFTSPVLAVAGIRTADDDPAAASCAPKTPPAPTEDDILHALFVIVDRGHTSDIVATAEAAGSTGATVFHCRRTDRESRAWHERLADPEKEIVILVAPKPTADSIEEALVALAQAHDGHIDVGRWPVHTFELLSDRR